jgi:hypothetical protein
MARQAKAAIAGLVLAGSNPFASFNVDEPKVSFDFQPAAQAESSPALSATQLAVDELLPKGHHRPERWIMHRLRRRSQRLMRRSTDPAVRDSAVRNTGRSHCGNVSSPQ